MRRVLGNIIFSRMQAGKDGQRAAGTEIKKIAMLISGLSERLSQHGEAS